MSERRLPVSLVIPTYNRGPIAVETIDQIKRQAASPAEILLIDQTPDYPPEVEQRLESLNESGEIRWIRLARPLIPGAMNRGLLEARYHTVVFLDDDSRPDDDFFTAHLRNYDDSSVWGVAGQVLQPWEKRINPPIRRSGSLLPDLDFPFNQVESAWVENVIGCNFSVRREKAIEIGGFDESFVGVAHRFESDFARRLVSAGGRIRFDPEASVRHLKLQSGGLRSYGQFLRSANPAHSVGDYYFALKHLEELRLLRYIARRLRQNILTRYHLRHPWWIPTKVIGEIRGLILAARLNRQGPRLLPPVESGS